MSALEALGPLLERLEPLKGPLLWSAVTIGAYLVARFIARRWRFWWTSPLLLTPIMVGLVAVSLHAGYAEYIRGTHWLVLMLGPATVAFAIPIYEQRAVIRRHWPVLLLGGAGGQLHRHGRGLLHGLLAGARLHHAAEPDAALHLDALRHGGVGRHRWHSGPDGGVRHPHRRRRSSAGRADPEGDAAALGPGAGRAVRHGRARGRRRPGPTRSAARKAPSPASSWCWRACSM